MKLIKTLSALALPVLAFGLAGCEDTIDLNDRYKPVPDSGEPARTVLIEEYTGIDCKNCPNGHARLAEIEEFYNTPSNLKKGVGVISVGIHIPVFGDPVDQGGFVTPEASNLAPGQTTAPAARVNRRTDVLEIDRWQTAVNSEITRRASVTFPELSATVSDGKLSVSGIVMAEAAINDARLQLWIVEDHIIDWQLMPDGKYNDSYEHHAVYRASITGLSGRDIELNRNIATPFEISAYPLHSNWNAANLRVVAFVESDEAGVLNAAQCAIQTIE